MVVDPGPDDGVRVVAERFTGGEVTASPGTVALGSVTLGSVALGAGLAAGGVGELADPGNGRPQPAIPNITPTRPTPNVLRMATVCSVSCRSGALPANP